MRASVQPALLTLLNKFEGPTTWMYLDVGDLKDSSVSGKVTTGIGDLIDAGPRQNDPGTGWSPALSLPWKNQDGSATSQEDIIAAWKAVKARQDLKRAGGGASGPFPALTTIRLTQEGMNQLVQGKIAANDDTLRGYFPNYDSFPADAQLGLHSMAWALGPHFPETWKNFTNALNGAASTTGTQGPPDYATAAVQSHISNATDARNAANMQMFQNAHTVAEQNLNYDTVFYPGEPSGSGGATPIAPAGATAQNPGQDAPGWASDLLNKIEQAAGMSPGGVLKGGGAPTNVTYNDNSSLTPQPPQSMEPPSNAGAGAAIVVGILAIVAIMYFSQKK
jgi:hypothetical protein